MTNSAGLAAIQAVGLLHQEGFELLRVWVTGRAEVWSGTEGRSTHLFCGIHLYRAGDSIQEVINLEVDHIVLSYDYTLNVNAILDGKIYPDFDWSELENGGWTDPIRMAKYLKGYTEFTEKWRGSDPKYASWFAQLTKLAQEGRMPG